MRIAPINASDTPELTWLMLRDLVETIPQAILISENETYRHYQFTTPLMGFIDDVELLYDRKKQLIQVKVHLVSGSLILGLTENVWSCYVKA